MSGIYIPGMEMPKEDAVICIFPDGTVQKRAIKFSTLYEVLERNRATHVPDHGDLVSRDWLKKQGYFFPCAIGSEYAIPLRALREAPTIISADRSLPKLPVEHGSVGASTKEEAIKALGFDPDDFKKEINHDRI